MARIADKTSVRQRVFAKLDGLSHLKRTQAIEVLVSEFAVSESYARTLYQNHRKIRSDAQHSDGFVTIFKVRDTRSNSPVDPYISSMVKNNPANWEARSEESAVKLYVVDNLRKSKLAKTLCSTQ